MQFIKNERGIVWVTLSLFLIPFVILFMAFVIDLAHGVWVSAQLQTAADAASMAGALTAEAIPEKEIVVIENEDEGESEGEGDEGDGGGRVVEKIVAWHAIISDPNLARSQAQEAATKNTLLISQTEGGFGPYESFKPTGADFKGSVLGDDSYYVTLKVRAKTILIGKVLKAYGQSTADTIDIEKYSIAKSYPDPDLPIGELGPPDEDPEP